MKDFDNWNKFKKQLNGRIRVPYCHKREIWWAAIGLNVRSEQDGKTELYERPIIILKVFNREMIKIAPLTTSVNSRSESITIYHNKRTSVVLLQQVRTISTKRLTRKMDRINTDQFIVIVKKYIETF